MQSILNAIRDIDLFAIPVSLTYKGKRKFGTLAGGFFTILLAIGFIAYSVHTIRDMIENPELYNNTQKLYFSFSDNSEVYNISTKNSTLAIQIRAISKDTD